MNDEFNKLMQDILSEGLDKIDSMSDEELERLVDCE